MGHTPTPDTQLTRLAELERRLAALETAPRLQNAAIRDPVTGQVVLLVGKLSSGEFGVLIARNDGRPALAAYSGQAEGLADQFIAIYDRAGNIVVSDNVVDDQGLANPLIPLHFASMDMSNAPGTTSGAFTAAETALLLKQHARVYVQALLIADAATAGEARLWDAGANAQIGATVVIGAGAFFYAVFSGAVAGAWQEQRQLDIQVRRTSGTGVVRARYVCAYGE